MIITERGLKKPAVTDPYDVQDANYNVDKLEEILDAVDQEMDQLFQSVSNGKSLVAGAITDKGVNTSPTDTFAVMADKIDAIVTDPSIGTTDAVAGDILLGKKVVSQGNLLTGTMPNRGPAVAETVNLTNYNQEYTIEQGSHSGLRKIKAVITNLAAGVIKAGVTVGGILGTFTSDATATAAQMLAGAKAYVNGVLVTGTIPSKGAQTYTPGTTNQTIAAGQYLSGIQTIAGDADLIAANIAANKNIFNVVGTYTGIKSIQTMIIQSTGAKTITGVVPANTIIIYQEYNQQNNDEWNITLTNSTTLTVSGTPAYGLATIIEFEAGVIKSKQRVTIGSSVAYNATVTISSVDPAKCIVLQMSAHHGSILYSTVGKVTAATTLTIWRSHSSWVDYLEVIEFY